MSLVYTILNAWKVKKSCKDVQNNSNSYTVPYFSIRHMKYLSKSKDDQQLVLA